MQMTTTETEAINQERRDSLKIKREKYRKNFFRTTPESRSQNPNDRLVKNNDETMGVERQHNNKIIIIIIMTVKYPNRQKMRTRGRLTNMRMSHLLIHGAGILDLLRLPEPFLPREGPRDKGCPQPPSGGW